MRNEIKVLAVLIIFSSLIFPVNGGISVGSGFTATLTSNNTSSREPMNNTSILGNSIVQKWINYVNKNYDEGNYNKSILKRYENALGSGFTATLKKNNNTSSIGARGKSNLGSGFAPSIQTGESPVGSGFAPSLEMQPTFKWNNTSSSNFGNDTMKVVSNASIKSLMENNKTHSSGNRSIKS